MQAIRMTLSGIIDLNHTAFSDGILPSVKQLINHVHTACDFSNYQPMDIGMQGTIKHTGSTTKEQSPVEWVFHIRPHDQALLLHIQDCLKAHGYCEKLIRSAHIKVDMVSVGEVTHSIKLHAVNEALSPTMTGNFFAYVPSSTNYEIPSPMATGYKAFTVYHPKRRVTFKTYEPLSMHYCNLTAEEKYLCLADMDNDHYFIYWL